MLTLKKIARSFTMLVLAISMLIPMAAPASAMEMSVMASVPNGVLAGSADVSVGTALPAVALPTGFSLEEEVPEIKAAAGVVDGKYIPTLEYDVVMKKNTITDVMLPHFESLGRFKLSFYCPCRRCNGNTHRKTASGTYLTEGRTIAVDKNKIPLGSLVHIDGIGDFIAEDTGSAIKGNRIDVYVSSHAEALRLGIKYANVYIAK